MPPPPPIAQEQYSKRDSVCFEQGAQSQCLKAFQKFLEQNLHALSHKPSRLFRLASRRQDSTLSSKTRVFGLFRCFCRQKCPPLTGTYTPAGARAHTLYFSRQAHVKAAQRERQNKAQRFLDEMNQLLSVQNSPLSAADDRAPALDRKKNIGDADKQATLKVSPHVFRVHSLFGCVRGPCAAAGVTVLAVFRQQARL